MEQVPSYLICTTKPVCVCPYVYSAHVRGCRPQDVFTFFVFFETSLTLGPGAHRLATMADKQAPSLLLCLQGWDYKDMPSCPVFMWVLGTNSGPHIYVKTLPTESCPSIIATVFYVFNLLPFYYQA